MLTETQLYPPIKLFLERQGYRVKAEVDHCDVVAYRADTPPLVVELKQKLSLDLVLQGINRLSITDNVYIAAAISSRPTRNSIWRRRRKEILGMCKRLGLGLMTVKPSSGQVCVLTEPKTYTPRKIKSRQLKLAREFDNRIGDPNVGGSSREKLMTVYRQDALRCALILDRLGDLSPKEVGRKADVKQAGRILQKNYYGWFERVERGVYRVSNIGKTNLEIYKEYLDSIVI